MCKVCDLTPERLELVRTSMEVVIGTLDDALSDIGRNPDRDVLEHVELIARLATWGVSTLGLEIGPTPEVTRIGKLLEVENAGA